MWRRQASKVVPMLQAAAAAMKLDSGRHGDDFIVFWECAVRCSMRNTSAQVLERMRMDGLHGLMNSLTLKLLLSCPPLSSTATCGLTHRPRNTHHKVVHCNPP